MPFRPSSLYLKPSLGHKMRYTSSAFSHGPHTMNISQPLSRASLVAEKTLQGQIQQKRNFGSYYYPFPKIPRPKRNVLYYSTWTKGTRLASGQKKLKLPYIRISRRLFSSANQKLKNKTKNFHKRFFSAEARKKRQQRRRFIRWWTLTSLTVVLGGVAAKIFPSKAISNCLQIFHYLHE